MWLLDEKQKMQILGYRLLPVNLLQEAKANARWNDVPFELSSVLISEKMTKNQFCFHIDFFFVWLYNNGPFPLSWSLFTTTLLFMYLLC